MARTNLLCGGVIGALAISLASAVGAHVSNDKELTVNGNFEMAQLTYAQWHGDGGIAQSVELQIIECQTDGMGLEEPYGQYSQQMRDMSARVAVHNRSRESTRDMHSEIYSVGSPEFAALERSVMSRSSALIIKGTGPRI